MRRMFVVTGVFVLGLALTAPAMFARQDEAAIDKAMKRVGPSFGAMRKAVEASNADMAKENAATIKAAMTETQAFFKAKSKTDAQGWAGDALKAVASIETALGAGQWDAVKAGAGDLGKTCQACHGAYRDKAEDGSYRLKPGSH